MKRLLLALSIALGIAFVFLLTTREPAYDGRSLTAWLEFREKSFGPPGTPFPIDQVAQVENAIRKIGPAAVPQLRKMLRAYDSLLRQRVVAICSKRPWIPIRFRAPAQTLHQRGIFGIRTLGPIGQPALPELVSLTRDPDWTIRASAANALGRIGEGASRAIPEIARLLTDQEPHVRAAACDALGGIGASPRPFLESLIHCLRDANDGVFNAALRTSSRIGLDSSIVGPVLIEQLNQKDPRIRYEAALALGGLGAKANAAVPELIKRTEDEDKDVREAASGALLKIDPSLSGHSIQPPPPPAADTASGSITLEVQAPTSVVLEIYKSIAQVELLMKPPGLVPPGIMNVRATRPLSPAEARVFLEKVFLEQAGLVLEHTDSKHVTVKSRH